MHHLLLVTDRQSARKYPEITADNEIEWMKSTLLIVTRHLQSLPYVMTCKDKLFMNIN